MPLAATVSTAVKWWGLFKWAFKISVCATSYIIIKNKVQYIKRKEKIKANKYYLHKFGQSENNKDRF